jgi:hypothetical protein
MTIATTAMAMAMAMATAMAADCVSKGDRAIDSS